MTKTELRTLYKNKRKEILPKDEIIFLLKIFHFLNNFKFENIKNILTYKQIENKKEIAVSHINIALQQLFPHLKFAYPISNFTTITMQAIIETNNTVWLKNEYGIVEPENGEIIRPENIDLALVPLLAFDVKGHRVGYGKGFYDRFLANCKPNCIKIGLSFFEPEQIISDANDYDVPLNYCITPQKVYEF